MILAHWSLTSLRGYSSEPFRQRSLQPGGHQQVPLRWAGRPPATSSPEGGPLLPLGSLPTPTSLFLIVPPRAEGLSFLTSLEAGVVLEAQPASQAGLLELIREEGPLGLRLVFNCGPSVKANDRGRRLSSRTLLISKFVQEVICNLLTFFTRVNSISSSLRRAQRRAKDRKPAELSGNFSRPGAPAPPPWELSPCVPLSLPAQEPGA